MSSMVKSSSDIGDNESVMAKTSTPRCLTKLRAICLALPGAKETISHGAPTFWSPKRTFANFADANTHHGGGRHAAWVKACYYDCAEGYYATDNDCVPCNASLVCAPGRVRSPCTAFAATPSA